MWTFLVFCIHACLHLFWSAECYGHSIGHLSRGVGDDFRTNSLSRMADVREDAHVLSNTGRKLRQAPPVGSDQAVVKTLDQLCPNRNSTSTTFTCEPDEITLSSGESVSAPNDLERRKCIIIG